MHHEEYTLKMNYQGNKEVPVGRNGKIRNFDEFILCKYGIISYLCKK